MNCNCIDTTTKYNITEEDLLELKQRASVNPCVIMQNPYFNFKDVSIKRANIVAIESGDNFVTIISPNYRLVFYATNRENITELHTLLLYLL